MASADIYVKITKMMVSSLDNSHNLIISAACLSLAELGRSGPLPLEAGGQGQVLVHFALGNLVFDGDAQRQVLAPKGAKGKLPCPGCLNT